MSLPPHFDSKVLPSREPPCPFHDTFYRRVCENGLPPAMERVRALVALIDRQMTGLSAQAAVWRASATECQRNAALSSIPDIKSKMFEIAEAYEGIALSAEQHCRKYSKKPRADFWDLSYAATPRKEIPGELVSRLLPA
jgi:hypothetical protein